MTAINFLESGEILILKKCEIRKVNENNLLLLYQIVLK